MSRPAAAHPQLRGDIEGLRAIAVLSVLLFHMGIEGLSGGFAGVDVFFVISGFLITSLLLKEVERSGRVSIAEFYARRARRLLPAATLVLVVSGVAGVAVLSADQYRNLGIDIAAAAGYVLNWVLAARSVDYLAEDAGASPVQHYWSLSVEEQFYVGWPLLLMLAAFVARRVRWNFRVLSFVLLGAVFTASLVASVRHTARSPQTAYFVSTTRIWELGAGALLAILVPVLARGRRSVGLALSWAGIAAVGLTFVVISTSTAWPGTAALLPVLGTTAVIAGGCVALDTPVARALGVGPMRWIGGLSYSIYLWHWPLIVLAKAKWPGISTAQVVVVGSLSIPLAWLTRQLLEDPVRFSRVLSARPWRSLTMGALGMAMSFGVAYAVVQKVPELEAPTVEQTGALALVADTSVTGVPALVEDPSAAFTTTGDIVPNPAVAPEDVPGYNADGCQVDANGTEPLERCVYGNPDGATTVALIGDSKMGQWLPAVEAIAAIADWRIELYLKSGCTFTPLMTSIDGDDYTSCQEFGANTVDLLTTPGTVPDIVIISQARSNADGTFGEVEPAMVDGLVDYWTRLRDAGATVVVLADNPSPINAELPGGGPVYACVQREVADYRACSFSANDGGGTPAMREAVPRVPGVAFVDVNQWICPPGGECPPVIGKRLIYRQGTHITVSYVTSLTAILQRSMLAEGVAAGEEMPLEPAG